MQVQVWSKFLIFKLCWCYQSRSSHIFGAFLIWTQKAYTFKSLPLAKLNNQLFIPSESQYAGLEILRDSPTLTKTSSFRTKHKTNVFQGSVEMTMGNRAFPKAKRCRTVDHSSTSIYIELENIQNSGSQSGLVLPLLPGGHLAMSGSTSGCWN